ncbi:hypothetical protein BK122_26720 [Paenibacillus pabuli]|nr:hypothetical protein BK122_26720 [Paenibacillus pabuli]
MTNGPCKQVVFLGDKNEYIIGQLKCATLFSNFFYALLFTLFHEVKSMFTPEMSFTNLSP